MIVWIDGNKTMASDIITTFEGSILQHGKLNDRVYLMKLDKNDPERTFDHIDTLVKSNHYSKIFAKIPASLKNDAGARGYIVEAGIPRFFNGEEDVFFMSKFPQKRRQETSDKSKIEDVIKVSLEKQRGPKALPPLDSAFKIRIASFSDAGDISALYKRVFASYPFPIDNPLYIAETMKDNFAYFVLENDEQPLSVASCEMDIDYKNVEMTDFATLPDQRGQGFALYLLTKMETFMTEKSFKTAFTIARALSYPMNITFAKLGYTFGGTLINNTNISGGIESMNVWYKPLS